MMFFALLFISLVVFFFLLHFILE